MPHGSLEILHLFYLHKDQILSTEQPLFAQQIKLLLQIHALVVTKHLKTTLKSFCCLFNELKMNFVVRFRIFLRCVVCFHTNWIIKKFNEYRTVVKIKFVLAFTINCYWLQTNPLIYLVLRSLFLFIYYLI